MDPGLRNIVTSRLEADASADGAWGVLVLGAIEGPDGLEAWFSVVGELVERVGASTPTKDSLARR